MREIKFRAWHEVGKSVRPPIPGMLYDEKPGDCLVWLNQGQKIVSIMQFTGLLDKTGKEIYEGDVLGHNEHVAAEVFYNTNVAAFGIRYESQPIKISFNDVDLDEWEVIGNIYENPELLK